MKVRWIVLAMTVLLPVAATAAAEDPHFRPFVSPQDMSEACGYVATADEHSHRPPREDAYAFLCLGYVRGWAEAAMHNDKTCAPRSLTNARLIEIFQSAARHVPRGSTTSTADVMAGALAQTFPCSP